MDEVDRAQKLLEGECPECGNKLTTGHKMQCSTKYRESWWNGKQLTLDFDYEDDYWEFEQEMINSELDKR